MAENDPADAAEALAEGMADAFLRGMSDVEDRRGPEDGDPEMAEGDDAGGAAVDFRERIDFFRRKLSLPTRAWTDIWEAQHDVAFVVAGAARDALLADLREAVDASIADGETLREFRKRFDAIVSRHGWNYRGGRDWRTRVIWQTNRATSYAAGRWRQMEAVADRRPFWRYRHSPASVEPRHKHVSWDGLILRHDDPWWQVHWPPNGWGCKCWVDALSRREADRAGGPGSAPPTTWSRGTVGSGPTAREVDVAEGVDPGFAYAPGRNAALGEAVRRRLQASLRLPPGLAADSAFEALTGIGAAHRRGPKGVMDTDPKRVRATARRRLAADREAGQAAATANAQHDIDPWEHQKNKMAAKTVRDASKMFPASWVRKAGPLTVRAATPQELKQFSGSYSYAAKRAIVSGALDNAIHEYVHHLQVTLPGFQKVFRDFHLRRTTKNGQRDPLVTKDGHSNVRPDAYVSAYMGKDYGPGVAGAASHPDLKDGDALELAARTFQILFDSVHGKEKLGDLAIDDPELLDLALGLLFAWDP